MQKEMFLWERKSRGKSVGNHKIRSVKKPRNSSVYAEFDECTRSENFIEILRFKHFARYMSFTPTGKQGQKKQIMNGIEVSVVLHLV